MTLPALPQIKTDGFAFSPAQGDAEVKVDVSGNADMRVMDELDRALEALGPALQAYGARSVVFDIRSLYFMNSSCFKCFVTFIVTILDLPKARHVRVVFLSNPKLHWQDRSLEAIRSIAPEIVRIETS